MTERRRVVAQQWISVDGFASGPTDEWELFAAVPEAADAAAMAFNTAFLPGIETVVLGRRSYESFVDFWPTDRAREIPVAPLVNAVPKPVASTTLTAAPWGPYAPAQVVPDAVSHLRALRAEPGGPVLVWGSLALMRALLDAGQVDELDLWVAPVVLGAGTPLVTPGRSSALRQIGGEVLDGGATHLRYAVDDAAPAS